LPEPKADRSVLVKIEKYKKIGEYSFRIKIIRLVL
jgi:hypothetical protein